jgi:6-phosphogluconolactonase
MTRRTLIQTGAALLPAFDAAAQAQGKGAVYAYTGCYTAARRYGRGDGIHVYRVDPETAAWTHVQKVGDIVNPSFLTMRRDQRFLYSVHGDETYVTAFAVDRGTGNLKLLGRAEADGSNGVHSAVDLAGRFLVVANYGSGNVAVLPIREDGSLENAAQVVPLPGQPGPHRVEQVSSHPHNIVFDPSGQYVVVPDKGLDRVFVFRFDTATGKLTPTAQGSVVARPFSGPRHAMFHPTLPVLWVVNEIGSSVTTYNWDAERGHLHPVQVLPSIPSDYTGENTAAEIAVSANGRFVYASNRGHNSVAIFSANPGTGLLTSVGWVPSEGRTPRFIGLDPAGRHLYAANQDADTIVPFRVDTSTGRLSRAGEIAHTGSPVCIAWLA